MAEGKPGADKGAELYRRFRAGDTVAFEQLVVLYRNPLVSYLNGFVNDLQVADDLALDAFAELAVTTRFQARSSLKTYLFAIGRHLAQGYIKQFMNSNHIPTDQIIEDTSKAVSSIEDEYLRVEQHQQLYAAMRLLKSEYREVLYLVYFENLSYAEAGQTMKKTEKQIRNLVYAAKASLRKLLTTTRGLAHGAA
jgi:RNA polymerase sigma-70 factor (ECF subfamily)